MFSKLWKASLRLCEHHCFRMIYEAFDSLFIVEWTKSSELHAPRHIEVHKNTVAIIVRDLSWAKRVKAFSAKTDNEQ